MSLQQKCYICFKAFQRNYVTSSLLSCRSLETSLFFVGEVYDSAQTKLNLIPYFSQCIRKIRNLIALSRRTLKHSILLFHQLLIPVVAPYIFLLAFRLARCVDVCQEAYEGYQQDWDADRMDLVVQAA